MEKLESITEVSNKSVGKEEISYAEHIVVATNCLYKSYRALEKDESRDTADTDGVRGDLALELFTKTTKSGICLVVCDGGSSTEFLAALEVFQDRGLTLIGSDTPGRGPQRRSAFQTATQLPNNEVIIYTQAEKVPPENEGNRPIDYFIKISKPILEGGADIVIPKRNHLLFEQSYPSYMRNSEIIVNNTYNYLMQKTGLMRQGESFDWFFGQVVFKNDPEIVAMFLKKHEVKGKIRSRIKAKPDPEMHSDGHYFPIIEALFKGKRIVSVEVPFVYPPIQKENEMSPEKIADFTKRRQEDGAAYRLEAIHFLAYLRDDPRSRIREVTFE